MQDMMRLNPGKAGYMELIVEEDLFQQYIPAFRGKRKISPIVIFRRNQLMKHPALLLREVMHMSGNGSGKITFLQVEKPVPEGVIIMWHESEILGQSDTEMQMKMLKIFLNRIQNHTGILQEMK